jgi:hypothetical protein
MEEKLDRQYIANRLFQIMLVALTLLALIGAIVDLK